MTFTRILELLIPSGASIAGISVVLFLLKNWVQTRITKAIEQEYKEKALHLESSLRKNNDEVVANIKATLDNSASVLKASLEHQSFRSRKIADREFDSLDKLWAAFLAAKESMPGAMRFYDVVKANELEYYLSKDDFRRNVQCLMSPQALISENLSETHDILRPYVDQDSWVTFLSFRIILVRIKFLVSQD